MENNYIKVNKEAYNNLAKEYEERNYVVQDNFYNDIMFKNLKFKNGEKLLEIGPGRGARLKNFCDYGLDVTAIELSEEMGKLCSKKAPKAKIIIKNVLECDFDFQFDYIYMEAVIHNFPIEEIKKLFNLIYKWLKDDGILICTTTIDENDFECYEEKHDYKNKIKRFRHHYTEKSFEELFIKHHFKILNKKYKEEIDNTRKKLWQILYLGK